MVNGEGVDGVDKIDVGDTITVTGYIKRYNAATVEFDSGCTLDAYKKGEAAPVEIPTFDTAEELLIAAYALSDGQYLANQQQKYSLTGVITLVNTAYNAQYGNVSVTIVADGLTDYPIQCYRMKGEGAADLKVGDVITVTGSIQNYNGTIEFTSGCTFTFAGNVPTGDSALIAIALTAIAALSCAVVVGKKKSVIK